MAYPCLYTQSSGLSVGWGNYAGIIFSIMQGLIIMLALCKQIIKES